jgi:TonB-linked SusC/RagA family outer membrane protein
MRIILSFCALLLFVSSTYGQSRTVRGTVSDASDGTALPGVNVVVKGTTKGVSTNGSGEYAIELADNEEVLSFSFVGYKTIETAVGDRTAIDIKLETEVTTLEDVVVVGYGVVRKSDLTGSVSSVKGSDLTKIPAASPVLALQGKVPGVQITTASGEPGASAIVRIRGVGTFNNASPIYVVDGVILDNIDFLNSADIQSVEVLKDASATAIYGSRGANGVIIVTTKKGKQGQEYPTISVNGDYSIQSLNKRIDLLNGKEFATVVNEINPGSFNNVDAVPNTDWQDLIFRTAPIQNYQVSAAGATPNSQYYVGVGYFNQEGIIPKSKFERLSIKLNNSYNISKSVRFGNNSPLRPINDKTQITMPSL